MLRLISLAALFTTLISLSSFAEGVGSSGGGHGLLLDGKPYCLDLVEAGVEKSPYFNPETKPEETIVKSIRKVLPKEVSDKAVELVAHKIAEIKNVSSAWSLVIADAFMQYDFRMVDSSLITIQDIFSVLKYDPKLLVQLAIRQGYSISIDKKWWPELDPENQAALLFHEIVYSLAEERMVDTLDGYDFNGRPIVSKRLGQSSPLARSLNGYLFTEKFKTAETQKLMNLATGSELSKIILSVAKKSEVIGDHTEYYDHVTVMAKNDYDWMFATRFEIYSNSTQREIATACAALAKSRTGGVIGILTNFTMSLNSNVSGLKIEERTSTPHFDHFFLTESPSSEAQCVSNITTLFQNI